VHHCDGESTHGKPENKGFAIHVESEAQESTQSRSNYRLEKEATEWHPPQKSEDRDGAHEKAAHPADERDRREDFHTTVGERARAIYDQANDGETEHARHRPGHDAGDRHSEADLQ
jgi:hypothetical protein